MVQVTYPIPYLIRATINRERRMVDVADEIVRDIREVEETEAPVVLTCKLNSPNRNIHNPVCDRPTVFRSYEGKIYAPCMVVSKDFEAVEQRQLVADDFANLAQQEFYWSTPFDKQYPHQANQGGNLSLPADRLRKYQSGELPRREQLPIRNSQTGSDGRGAVIAAAEADLAKYISIEGKLWRQTLEPVIRYMRFTQGTTLIYLDENKDILQQTEARGAFRIDRMQDCLDHVEAFTTSRSGSPDAFLYHVKDIIVSDSSAFTFNDEQDSVIRLAKRLYEPLYYQALIHEDTMTPDQRTAVLIMQDAMERRSDDDIEKLAEIIRDFSNNWPVPTFPLPTDVPFLLERWDLRPAGQGAGMKI
jgi:hypothetical protein